MGYIRTAERRPRLCCDRCGRAGDVRKRTCTQRVRNADGSVLPYCSPPALCPECYRALGQAKGVHGECRERAAASQERENKKIALIEKGEHLLRTAWGDWHENVPKGFLGALFEGKDGDVRVAMLEEDYAKRTDMEIATIEEFHRRGIETLPWVGTARTKEVGVA